MDISITTRPLHIPESARVDRERQAERYAQCFRIFSDYADVIDRVTFWGTNDRFSWINRVDRPDHPLLFGKQQNSNRRFGRLSSREPWHLTRGLHEGAAQLFDVDGSVIANLIPGSTTPQSSGVGAELGRCAGHRVGERLPDGGICGAGVWLGATDLHGQGHRRQPQRMFGCW